MSEPKCNQPGCCLRIVNRNVKVSGRRGRYEADVDVADGQTVCLKEVTVLGIVRDLTCIVRVTQRYVNENAVPVEVECVCPKPSTGVLFHVSAEIDGKVIRTRIIEKKEGERQYAAALRAGKLALKAHTRLSGDAVVLHLGNLPPGATCTISLCQITPTQSSKPTAIKPSLALPSGGLSPFAASAGESHQKVAFAAAEAGAKTVGVSTIAAAEAGAKTVGVSTIAAAEACAAANISDVKSIGVSAPGGPLVAGEECGLALAEELRAAGCVELRIPTNLYPVYQSMAAARGAEVLATALAAAPRVAEAKSMPYTIKASFSVNMPSRVISVTSPGREGQMLWTPDAESDRRGEAKFEGPLAFDHDLVLVVETAAPFAPRAALERHLTHRDSYALEVSLALPPKRKFSSQRSEVHFLLDCSGSMWPEPRDDPEGRKNGRIQMVAKCLQPMLSSLTEDMCFNLHMFGDTVKSMWPAAVPYGDRKLAQARKWIANTLTVNGMGGTEILAALTKVLQRPARPGFARQVILLTDGEVQKQEQQLVCDYLRQNLSDARVFAIGIGSGASEELVRAVSQAGNGSHVMIAGTEPQDNFGTKCATIMERALEAAAVGLPAAPGRSAFRILIPHATNPPRVLPSSPLAHPLANHPPPPAAATIIPPSVVTRSPPLDHPLAKPLPAAAAAASAAIPPPSVVTGSPPLDHPLAKPLPAAAAAAAAAASAPILPPSIVTGSPPLDHPLANPLAEPLSAGAAAIRSLPAVTRVAAPPAAAGAAAVAAAVAAPSACSAAAIAVAAVAPGAAAVAGNGVSAAGSEIKNAGTAGVVTVGAWSELVDVWPRGGRCVYAGERVVLYAMLSETEAAQVQSAGQVRVAYAFSDELGQGERVERVPLVSGGAPADGDMVHRLAAVERIADQERILEMAKAAERGRLNTSTIFDDDDVELDRLLPEDESTRAHIVFERQERMRAEIVAASVRWQVPCEATIFVGVSADPIIDPSAAPLLHQTTPMYGQPGLAGAVSEGIGIEDAHFHSLVQPDKVAAGCYTVDSLERLDSLMEKNVDLHELMSQNGTISNVQNQCAVFYRKSAQRPSLFQRFSNWLGIGGSRASATPPARSAQVAAPAATSVKKTEAKDAAVPAIALAELVSWQTAAGSWPWSTPGQPSSGQCILILLRPILGEIRWKTLWQLVAAHSGPPPATMPSSKIPRPQPAAPGGGPAAAAAAAAAGAGVDQAAAGGGAAAVSAHPSKQTGVDLASELSLMWIVTCACRLALRASFSAREIEWRAVDRKAQRWLDAPAHQVQPALRAETDRLLADSQSPQCGATAQASK
jgi:hypothetical protein